MAKISQLFDYHAWATDKLLVYIEKEVPQSFSTQIESVFPSVKETFQHLYEVDCLWYDRMNEAFHNDDSKVLSSPEEYRAAFQELHQEILGFIKDTEDLENLINYRTSNGEKFTNSLEDLLQHLVNHGTYHRGNISAMLRQQGYPGHSTDYIYFLREKE
ncbi:DinB family protein [Bacillus salacetis]|uniref:DinB family protein n=1 Tax=Bacillus salacetis TaxID=2315464 RepID=UPI003BA266AF